MKAIETTYKGFRFRSRTEARWAVFFDALGIKWDYEKDGYDLGEEGAYLPDFWLSGFRMFAEVKGEEFTVKEANRCRLLAKHSGKSVLMLVGQPASQMYRLELPSGLCDEGLPALEGTDHRLIAGAVLRARSARFEHGAQPDDTPLAEQRSVRVGYGNFKRFRPRGDTET